MDGLFTVLWRAWAAIFLRIICAARHAHRVYKEIVAAYEPPAMDPGVKEELDAFVERRVREGGAPSEF